MFKKSQDNHILDYAILIGILAATTISVKIFNLHNSSLKLTSIFLSLAYVIWGIVHHKKAGHIDKKIVLEYSGLAILVNIIIFSLV